MTARRFTTIHHKPRQNKPSAPSLLVIVIGIHFCLLPWALGGEGALTHFLSLALGIAAMVLTIRTGARSTLENILEFPLFWLGVAICIQISLQAANPAFAYQSKGDDWWLDPIKSISWLPSGMQTPFEDMNGWRVLLRYAGPWLALCALRVGVESREQVRWLLVALAGNALAFTVYGLLARAQGSPMIYGAYSVDYPYFFGGIVYKNHAAAFLVLVLGVKASLALEYMQRRRKGEERGSPLILWILGCVLLGLGIVVTRSAAGCVMLGGVVSVAVYAATVQNSKQRGRVRAMGAGALVLLAIGALAVSSLERIEPRLSDEGSSSTTLSDLKWKSLEMRVLANRAGVEMFLDRPIFGWGAGSFRYGFTHYRDQRPELTRDRQLTLHWEHVHNDWLEFAIEFGVLGLSMVVATAFVWWWRFREKRLRLSTSSLPAAAAILGVGLYALFDFPFQSPAVAFTFGVVALTLRWSPIQTAELRQNNLAPAGPPNPDQIR